MWHKDDDDDDDDDDDENIDDDDNETFLNPSTPPFPSSLPTAIGLSS
jgi:hypothetical protein